MGATGSGKSSFINLLTGKTSVAIGDSLESETADVADIRFIDSATGRKVTIVDTPGFDDSRQGVTDTDILKKIANFLLAEYDADRKLNCLLYIQRISDPRFSGQQGKNLRMFQNLCGTQMYKNVVVMTTFWDQVSPEVGAKREAQLQSNFFKDLAQGGALFMRHDRTPESAAKLLNHVFAKLAPVTAQIQIEMGKEKKSLVDTAAGSVQQQEIERVIAKHKEEITDLKAEMETITQSNIAARRELEEERAKLRQQLARWESEKAALQKGLDAESRARQKLEADAAMERETHEKWRQEQERKLEEAQAKARAAAEENINTRRNQLDRTRSTEVDSRQRNSSPALGGFMKGLIRDGRRLAYKFAHSDKYPPHLKSIPWKNRASVFDIFDFSALAETAAALLLPLNLLPQIRNMVPNSNGGRLTMSQIVAHNQELHNKSREGARAGSSGYKPDMYLNKNVGLRDDWYTDAVYGQQQFTGTNPTIIALAPPRWIEEFKTVSNVQQRPDVASLLTDSPASIFIQDYSYFRSAMGVSPSYEFASDGLYGCSSVVLFHLEPEGKLHPLAITLDYKGSMKESVTIFNRRISTTIPGDEADDWPWRYAKMCAQSSDWLRHEVVTHLVHTHLVEEVIIVAAHRTVEADHIVFQLLEPHWSTTLSLNAGARETLVPKIIVPLTGFTPKQMFAFLKDAYNRFDWTGSYVPNDLRKRGFPIEDLDKRKCHNYGYARNISRMWDILRKFVRTVLEDAYPGGDEQVVNDESLASLFEEVRSRNGGQLSSFPVIKTLDGLIDFITMCIHIASPQHTAINYLQQYYQTFIPNKPSALFNRLPQSLIELQKFGEDDVLSALPILRPREWWIMAHVPYLLSFEMPEDNTILHYATTVSNSTSAPLAICRAARTLRTDLDAFSLDVSRYSLELDDQQTPYDVLHP
ncbi:hypothetical protein HYPSUDRAFT_644507 [Hypholoma sublateritium FD-334 SS-4]|uniref:Manganese lipoxygenase n=1 Tax=Hypholoma sublateritium (strain FD-334 SS-4) TaxID=945553 RepID=A0A0D2NUX8_HYPSF|nr:hypothetical protein HYPSUDRAFT_644507 [Hypholoma sublateritium FD-334 SS-4]